MEHNFTFWEYFKFQINSYRKEIKNSLDTNKKLNSLTKYSRKYQEKTSIHIFIWALAISILIFLFIYYFAISKTYISITPKVTIKKESHNFVFKENTDNAILWNDNIIKIRILSETIHSSDTYAATEIERDNNNVSKWMIRIYNNTLEEVTLVPNTRVQTKEGIVFEILTWAKIPTWVKDNFWKISPGNFEVQVNSQKLDTSWKYIWERGNISKDTFLLIPWLPEQSQKNIYAESIEDFSWWSNTYEKIISDTDIETAKEIFTQKIKTEIINSIKNNILEENRKNNSEIDILSWWKSIHYSEPKIYIQDWAEVGKTMDSFSINWSITAYVYTYNKTDIIHKLRILLNEKNLTGIEKISHIDNNSLRMSEIIYSSEKPFEMKATFEIEGLFLNDFLHKDNTYTSNLKSEIRWLEKDKAEKILLNNPKISNVSIDIRPFFTKNISNIYNNIILKVE
jgi:hypothetical protein